jgi:hypothetical protein
LGTASQRYALERIASAMLAPSALMWTIPKLSLLILPPEGDEDAGEKRVLMRGELAANSKKQRPVWVRTALIN